MDLEIVLNELSFRQLADNVVDARQRMSELLNTILDAVRRGVKGGFRVDEGMRYMELAPDYPIARWLNDGLVNKDLRSYFRSLATKISYIDGLPEYIHQEQRARGLGFAYQNDHLAISLDSEMVWQGSQVQVEVRYLELDENDELLTGFVQVRHACCPEHVEGHAGWIKARVKSEIRSGSDIWERRDGLYPHLQFCASVGKQLDVVLHGDRMLIPILRSLSELEQFCNAWIDSSPFNPKAISGNVSLESEATLKKFSQERTFRCPDGEYVLFNWHSKINLDKWRIHFHPLGDKRQIIIGYIGPHLPIVSQ